MKLARHLTGYASPLAAGVAGKAYPLLGKDITNVSEEVMARLMEHDFPGNVRELENIIEQAFVLCRGMTIELRHLPPELRLSTVAGTHSLNHTSLKAMEMRKRHVNRGTKGVILSMVQDRPCTIGQITNAFSNKSYEVVKLLSDMVRHGQIMVKSTDEGLFVVSSNSNL